MNGYVVYLAVQQQTAEFSHEARPGARVQLDAEAGRNGERGVAVRHQLSGSLRRLADRIEPRSAHGPLAAAGGR